MRVSSDITQKEHRSN